MCHFATAFVRFFRQTKAIISPPIKTKATVVGSGTGSKANPIGVFPIDLTGLTMAGREFREVNFSGSTLTGAQLNTLSYGTISRADLSNLNLSDWDTTGRYVVSNLMGTTISTEQLNAMASYAGSNLSNRNLSGLVTTGKIVGGVNFVGTNVTIEQLVSSDGIHGSNPPTVLTGTGITRSALEAALSAAGMSGYYFRTDGVQF